MSDKTVLINQFFKYINTTTGRDKINRTLQHTFKFLLAYNIKYNGKEETIAWIRNVIKNIQLSRKFVRIGKPLEHLNTFYKSLTLKDDFSKYCVLGRNLAYTIYLTFDMMVWFHKSGVKKSENIKNISKNSQRFWLIGIIFGIMNELFKLRKTNEKIFAITNVKSIDEEKPEEKKRNADDLKKLLDKKRNHYLTLTQHFCDFVHPISGLGFCRIDPLYLGLFGITSSVLGARAQWIKVNGKK
ncbi:peroxisomal biogenesis factor 11 [Neocallimastix lanati (nom. inval.)]|jgi:peroxin-11B|uniref:Peroxisomal biogenesis factor 11 n=1 Tax=Neocallimastix californiae TaxID=1754190 RepID=A0A1Y2AQ70_9FUNG|nr:peroxisomal biogenesis factor 11 [Neocallimastix sp. JGI-2020a]ORY24636.1 peroxisomal biogenesis factor 11 [Neocallimastix californiae]|eukprot:ORY24636.1 peroxisomal biogenesis factor 11 [Neocallimastix californiae]